MRPCKSNQPSNGLVHCPNHRWTNNNKYVGMLSHPSFFLLLLASYGWCVMCQQPSAQEPLSLTLTHTVAVAACAMPYQPSVDNYRLPHSHLGHPCIISRLITANCTLIVVFVHHHLLLYTRWWCTPNGREKNQNFNTTISCERVCKAKRWECKLQIIANDDVCSMYDYWLVCQNVVSRIGCPYCKPLSKPTLHPMKSHLSQPVTTLQQWEFAAPSLLPWRERGLSFAVVRGKVPNGRPRIIIKDVVKYNIYKSRALSSSSGSLV